MKNRKRKLSDRALGKINRKSEEFGKIWDSENENREDEFSNHSEDTLHSDKQINKNLGEY